MKKIGIKKVIAVIIAAVFCGIVCGVIYSNWAHKPELEFEHYMKHFQNVKTGEDAIKIFGKPKDIDRDYSETEPDRSTYTLLQYDGFAFGILGEENDRIVMVRITKKGILPLRNGVDIGDSRTKVKIVYFGTQTFEEGGYSLRHSWDPTGWESICIFPEYDENGILVSFSVTDGL